MILCSTFHDPHFSLEKLLKSSIPIINKLFSKTIVCCTPITEKSAVDYLKDAGFIVNINYKDTVVDTYKMAIKTALESMEKTKDEKVFYIDFDRLIHWANKYPDELSNILQENDDVDYLHIGRTPKAFNTHPKTQVKTELIVNEFGSRILGVGETMDLISVCYIFTKELGLKILEEKNITDAGFYGSWPVLFWNWASPSSRRYIQAEGLDWETPDRFEDEINDKGYEEWLKSFQSSREWEKRVRYLHDCLIELAELTRFNFAR